MSPDGSLEVHCSERIDVQAVPKALLLRWLDNLPEHAAVTAGTGGLQATWTQIVHARD